MMPDYDKTKRLAGSSAFWKFVEELNIWRRFVILVVGLFTLLGFLLAFVLPKEYQGVASVLPSQKGGLLGLMGGSSSLGSLARQFAPLVGAGSELGTGFNYLAILNSRDAMEKVVRKFDLMRVYGIKDSSMEKAIKELRNNTTFEIDEYGAVVIKVMDKKPWRAAAMANYFVEVLNEINGKLSSEDAHNNMLVVEKRFNQNLADLRAAEDSLQSFQQKYGYISLPDQMKASIATGSELEAQIILSEVKLGVIEKQLSQTSPEVRSLQEQITELKSKLNDLNKGSNSGNGNGFSLLVPFRKAPEQLKRYLDLYRNVELQAKLMEILYPLYEQAKLEEAKETPTVLVLDRAVPPERKARPMRLLIIVSAFVLGMASSISLILMIEGGLKKRESESGSLQQSYYKFASLVVMKLRRWGLLQVGNPMV
ncbi:MAG: GumC family protein [Candidatus Kryptoniota bacterium]